MRPIVPWPQHLVSLEFPTRVLREAARITRSETALWVQRGYIPSVGGGSKGIERQFSFETIYKTTLATALIRNGIPPGVAFPLVDRDSGYPDARPRYFRVHPSELYPLGPEQLTTLSGEPHSDLGKKGVENLFGPALALVPTTERGTIPPSIADGPRLPSVLLVDVNALMARIVRAAERHRQESRSPLPRSCCGQHGATD